MTASAPTLKRAPLITALGLRQRAECADVLRVLGEAGILDPDFHDFDRFAREVTVYLDRLDSE